MDSLSKCIEYHNHFTTLSIRDSYILRNRYHKELSEEETADFEESITLYEFMYSFGKMYKIFKEEMNGLPIFNLGDSFEIWDHSNYEGEEEVTLIINNPNIIDNDFCYLNIVKNKEGIKSYISIDDHEYYEKSNEINLDKDFCSKYFNFIIKYAHFIDCYNISKGNTMASWQLCQIISDYSGDLYKGLDSIILKINMDYHNYEYNSIIYFDLNNLSIDYDKSTLSGVDKEKNKAIDMLVNNIYINKSRIAPVYTDTEEEKVLRLKKGLDI